MVLGLGPAPLPRREAKIGLHRRHNVPHALELNGSSRFPNPEVTDQPKEGEFVASDLVGRSPRKGFPQSSFPNTPKDKKEPDQLLRLVPYSEDESSKGDNATPPENELAVGCVADQDGDLPNDVMSPTWGAKAAEVRSTPPSDMLHSLVLTARQLTLPKVAGVPDTTGQRERRKSTRKRKRIPAREPSLEKRPRRQCTMVKLEPEAGRKAGKRARKPAVKLGQKMLPREVADRRIANILGHRVHIPTEVFG